MLVKKLIFLLSVILFSLLALYGVLIWNNNRDVAPVGKAEIRRSLNAGIDWLQAHRQTILKDANPVLWRMLQESARVSRDARLQSLFKAYEAIYLERRRLGMWRPLFYDNAWSPPRYEEIRNFPYYNKHFLYALNCDRDLEQYPEISEQNDPDFCDRHLLRPACVTHQLMGIRMLQRKKCGDPKKLQQTVAVLQDRIVRQLFYDPRVVDVYLQRVLMLIESGAASRVKPVWLRRVIEAQSEAGGWSNFQPLLPLFGQQSLGFTQRGVGIRKRRDTFHATVQGVLTMSLLSESN